MHKNILTQETLSRLPVPLIRDGRPNFSPTPQQYHEAGWRDVVDMPTPEGYVRAGWQEEVWNEAQDRYERHPITITQAEWDAHQQAIKEANLTPWQKATRIAMDAAVHAESLTAEQMLEIVDVFPVWATGKAYAIGDIRRHENRLYECIQAHTSQSDWQPPDVPALWKAHTPDTIAEWVQPTGGHDAYQTGDLVMFEGGVWKSLIDANTWSPTASPQGWEMQ